MCPRQGYANYSPQATSSQWGLFTWSTNTLAWLSQFVWHQAVPNKDYSFTVKYRQNNMLNKTKIFHHRFIYWRMVQPQMDRASVLYTWSNRTESGTRYTPAVDRWWLTFLMLRMLHTRTHHLKLPALTGNQHHGRVQGACPASYDMYPAQIVHGPSVLRPKLSNPGPEWSRTKNWTCSNTNFVTVDCSDALCSSSSELES